MIYDSSNTNVVPKTTIEVANKTTKLSIIALSSCDVNNEEHLIMITNACWHVILSSFDTISSNGIDNSVSDYYDNILCFSSKKTSHFIASAKW